MSNSVDEFEHAFQSCITALTSPSANYPHDSEEVKTSVDQTVQRFLDSAKAMESFFLQKRLYLSVHKPELLIKEDIDDIKTEIQRKDAVIQRFQEKLQSWKGMLSEQPPAPLGQQHLVPHPPGQGPQTMPPGSGMMPSMGPSMIPGQMHMRGPTPGQMMPHPSGMHATGPMTGPQMHPMGQGMSRMQSPHPAGSGMQMMSGGPRGQMMQTPGSHAYQSTQQNIAPGSAHPSFMSSQPSPGQPPHPPQAQQQQQASPLAFLERTTSNIGLPDSRR